MTNQEENYLKMTLMENDILIRNYIEENQMFIILGVTKVFGLEPG